MTKKEFENYLRMFPELEEEIERLKGNMEYYKAEREKYEVKAMPEERKASIIETIDRAYDETSGELERAIEARAAIERTLARVTPIQRMIIELKFWQNKRVKWADVAEKLNYHPKSVERLYGEFVKLVT